MIRKHEDKKTSLKKRNEAMLYASALRRNVLPPLMARLNAKNTPGVNMMRSKPRS